MKILLLGGTGMLGQAVKKEMGASHQVVARDLPDYDIRDDEAFAHDLDRTGPDAVVNCAAYTLVDEAEDEVDLAMEVNGHAPGRLAAACRGRRISLVHFGTDYVFDGTSQRPYREDDPVSPINTYGASKLLGEQEVASALPEGHLILRTSWLFGPGGKSFPRTILERFGAGQRTFRVVTDQVGRPTYTHDLASAARACLEKGLNGIYHAANGGETNWYDFARLIFESAGVLEQVEITPVRSSEFMTRAKRPAYSVLDTTKLEVDAMFAFVHHEDAINRYLYVSGLVPARAGSNGRR